MGKSRTVKVRLTDYEYRLMREIMARRGYRTQAAVVGQGIRRLASQLGVDVPEVEDGP